MKVLLATELTGKFYVANEDKDITFLEGENEAKIYRIMSDDATTKAYFVTHSRTKNVQMFEIDEHIPAFEAYKAAYNHATKILKI